MAGEGVGVRGQDEGDRVGQRPVEIEVDRACGVEHEMLRPLQSGRIRLKPDPVRRDTWDPTLAGLHRPIPAKAGSHVRLMIHSESRRRAEELAMQIEPFEMERMQSTWENQVEINLSESGVHPMRLAELLDDPGERAGLFAQLLCYTQTNGTPRLRDEIAALYPGASRDHVQVTNGGAEANFVATWRLVEPGDEVVVMVPNYMQTWGLARAFAGRASVREWPLVERRGLRWAPDIDALARLVTPKTRLVLICNPNNPTGARLDLGRTRRRSPRSPDATAPGCSRTRSTAAPSSMASRPLPSGAATSGPS